MAKKYIIELEENEHLYKTEMVLGEPVLCGVLAEPYTVPDLEKILEQAKADAYQEGLKDGQAVTLANEQNNAFNNGYKKCLEDMEQVRKEERDRGYEDGYHQGLDDAWEAAKKIARMDTDTSEKITGYFGLFSIMDNLTANEAIEEIRAYEQAQKELEESKKEQSVTAEEVMRQYLDRFCKVNRCRECVLHTSDFTCGRGYHFLTNNPVSDEEARKAYATVLEEMRR